MLKAVDRKRDLIARRTLVQKINQRTGVDQETIKEIFNTTFEIILEEAMSGKEVYIRWFGTFKYVFRKGGKEVANSFLDKSQRRVTPDCWRLKFTPGKGFARLLQLKEKED